MTVALAMMVKDEAHVLARAIESARPLVDTIHVLDTGSTDNTVNIAESFGAEVEHAQWEGFGPGRTAALRLARDSDWVLMLDADMTVEAHPGLRDWLHNDPDPDVGAWQVEVREQRVTYRLPMLTRGGLDWQYIGKVHEYLEDGGRKQRPLLGLTLHHERKPHPGRDEELLKVLLPDADDGDPRATYYAAQTLWCLGRIDDAAVMYDRRAAMRGTFEEERWHAQYMAARLRDNVDGLVAAWRARPHRHEPLTWAAKIVGTTTDDILFLETTAACVDHGTA